MAKTEMILIDSGRLQKELDKKGLNKTQASEMIFAGSPYLSHVMSKGEISHRRAKALEEILGIPLTAYEVVEDKEETGAEKVKILANEDVLKRLESIENKLDKLLSLWGGNYG